jgi:tRNA threonylcarbamoyl adenosine modification protein YeaZ
VLEAGGTGRERSLGASPAAPLAAPLLAPLLAIEMSQRSGSVALGRSADMVSVERFESGGSRDEDPLLPAIDRLVRGAGLGPRDLGAIAVSVGPGGFTGLRIAVTAAKCMSDALGIPAIAVPSALVAAAGAEAPGPWLVALASKRETTWLTGVGLSAVDGTDGTLRIIGTPGIVSAESMVVTSSAQGGFRTLLADEFVHASIVARARDAGCTIECPRFDALACWRVARAMWNRGETADPLRLAPLYPREPEAVTLWRERHGDA